MPDFYVYLIAAAGLAAAAIPVVYIGIQRRKKQIEDVFGDRQELSERDFYERYFESKGVPFYLVKKIREIFEEVLDADLSRLSAEDDLAKKLDFFWESDSLADEEIFEKIEEEFDIKFQPSDFENLQTTIGDIIETAWRKVREKDEFGA
jgi:acyl carrier protein